MVRTDTSNSLANRSAETPRVPLRRNISDRAWSRSTRFTVQA
jgi:hypothetical protein